MTKSTERAGELSERRGPTRYESVHRVQYKALLAKEGEGFTQNISQGGFALLLDDQVPPGAVLELRFEEPGKMTHPERAIVKVMWRRGHIAGVKLLGR
jgi:hypothetical protein